MCSACTGTTHAALPRPLCRSCSSTHPFWPRDLAAEAQIELVWSKLYILVFFEVNAALFLFFLSFAASGGPVRSSLQALAAFAAAVALGSAASAQALRRFSRWGLPLATLVALVVGAALPIGTWVAYVDLRALYGRSGRALFTDKYRKIVGPPPFPESPSPIDSRYYLMFILVLVVSATLLVALPWRR